MIVTTSHNVEGKSITSYLGIVTGGQLFALSVGKKGAHKVWNSAVTDVIDLLKKEAAALNADAIISVRFNNDDARVMATGTAVKLG